jgi:hypothetical protein
METTESAGTVRSPWNKGKLVGQKAPFKLKEIWAIRVRLQLAVRRRELAQAHIAFHFGAMYVLQIAQQVIAERSGEAVSLAP